MTARRNESAPASAIGPLLSNAASYAADAQRLLVASLVSVDAAADVEDIGELLNVAHAEPQVRFALLADVGSFADGLQRIADAYGYREVRRAACRGSG